LMSDDDDAWDGADFDDEDDYDEGVILMRG
jgi:hypothetical protein